MKEMTLREYLEVACPYLECHLVGRTPTEEKDFFKRIAEKYDLEKVFRAKANEDISWSNLAEKEVFYFVDVVKNGLRISRVDPEIKLLKFEFGKKAVIKLVVDTKTVHSFK